MKKIDYRSKLKLYLALRESLAVQVSQFQRPLESFVQFLEQADDSYQSYSEKAFDWATNTPSKCQMSTRASWLSHARLFLQHLKVSYPKIDIPNHGMIIAPKRKKPYIFAAREILSLIECAGELRPVNSIRPHVHQTLLGLLACTGMRPGEVIKLKNSNVHLEETEPRIYIEKSKSGRSRWIVLHPSAAQQLKLYADHRRAFGFEKSAAFFVNLKGKHIEGRNLRLAFTKLLKVAGIVQTGESRGPSLHSFRHTFAVTRLKRWYEQRADVKDLLPHLSVFMGHVDLEGTYWYLTATPELLTAAAELFDSFYAGGAYHENQE